MQSEIIYTTQVYLWSCYATRFRFNVRRLRHLLHLLRDSSPVLPNWMQNVSGRAFDVSFSESSRGCRYWARALQAAFDHDQHPDEDAHVRQHQHPESRIEGAKL